MAKRTTSKSSSSAKRGGKKSVETVTRAEAAIPMVTLSDEADVYRASNFKDEDGRGPKIYKIVGLVDIPEYGYIRNPSKQVKVKDSLDKAEKYHLEPYDVLVSIVGNVGQVGVVPEGFDGPWLPANTFVVVRFRDDKENKAIAFESFMQSKRGRAIVDELESGKTIKTISKKAFQKILIPEATASVKKGAKSVFGKVVKHYEKIEETKQAALDLRRSFLEDKL
jgi:hypothetical protein